MNTAPFNAREIEAPVFNRNGAGPSPLDRRTGASKPFAPVWVRLRKWLRCAPVVASAADWTFPGL
jgi:hypothetical protein